MTAPDGFIRVASRSDLVEGSLYEVEVDGSPRVLACLDTGVVCALDGICTHEHAELAAGDLEGVTLWCPLHAAGFDVNTGEATCLPATEPLRRYDVRVEADEVFVSQEPRPLP
jgi:nitrite reductase/ring-hydroxylating ferredoxin subunit